MIGIKLFRPFNFLKKEKILIRINKYKQTWDKYYTLTCIFLSKYTPKFLCSLADSGCKIPSSYCEFVNCYCSLFFISWALTNHQRTLLSMVLHNFPRECSHVLNSTVIISYLRSFSFWNLYFGVHKTPSFQWNDKHFYNATFLPNCEWFENWKKISNETLWHLFMVG